MTSKVNGKMEILSLCIFCTSSGGSSGSGSGSSISSDIGVEMNLSYLSADFDALEQAEERD